MSSSPLLPLSVRITKVYLNDRTSGHGTAGDETDWVKTLATVPAVPAIPIPGNFAVFAAGLSGDKYQLLPREERLQPKAAHAVDVGRWWTGCSRATQ